jgi:ligand-binding sensor domain-containing protein
VYSVYQDREGQVWIGTAILGAARFDGKQVQWFYEPRLSTTPQGGESGVRGIFQDRNGDYWISNTRHRYIVAKSRPKDARPNELVLDRKPGFPDAASDDGKNFDYFHSVVEDKNGALWFACGSGGVVRFHDETVTRYSLGKGDYSRAMLLDAEGTVWAGTYQGGLYTLVGDRFELFQESKATTNR